MENTNAPVTLKSRRTYLLAGIPCLCWEGALYAPLSGASGNLGAIQVGPGHEPGTVQVHGAFGEEAWHCESRESIKARGAKARRPSPRPAQAPAVQPAEEPTGEEPSELSDAIARLKSKLSA
jgi:hypothetical protein